MYTMQPICRVGLPDIPAMEVFHAAKRPACKLMTPSRLFGFQFAQDVRAHLRNEPYPCKHKTCRLDVRREAQDTNTTGTMAYLKMSGR